MILRIKGANMTQTQPDPPKSLSRHQYGTLKFIHNNKVALSYLRVAHAGTLSSLAYRGYLQRTGPHDTGQVVLTKEGQEALRVYSEASLNERAHERELTERCQRLLRYTARRKVVSMAS